MSIDIPGLVAAVPGGELVGKVRLQKTVYLLDQLGLNSGFSYEYHHYGRYSEELAEQVVDDGHRQRTAGVPPAPGQSLFGATPAVLSS